MSTPASPLPSPSYPSLSSSSTRNPALNPNPHPYAIKTTSTALLSRSNSSGFNTNAARNHYVPLSPSPSRSRSDLSSRHRSTKSQYIPDASPSAKAPRPLPTPPPFPTSDPDGYASADGTNAPRRARRTDTLPSAPAPYNVAPTPVTLDDLPSNPKLWTPNELSSYLTTALRVTSQKKSQDSNEVTLPLRVARDIAAFVKEMRITGRTFLRLNEEDLDIMGVNSKWREALLLASRDLRQNVLKGRIWGPDLDLGPDTVASPSSSLPSSTSSSPSRPLPNPPPFSNSHYNSSSNSIDLSKSNLNQDRGERPRRHRNGRVQGMVETFERSGSFSSDTGSVDEDRPHPSLVAEWRHQARNGDDDAISTGSISEPPSPLADTTFTAESTVIDPTVDGDVKGVEDVEDDEPTMEDLLAMSGAEIPNRGTWGARAWEEMDQAPGVTVKRISPDGGMNGVDTIMPNVTGNRTESGRSSERKTRKQGRVKDERRIVTAIFAPPPSSPALLPDMVHGGTEEEPEKSNLEPPPVDTNLNQGNRDHEHIQAAGNVELEQRPMERILLDELAETRAMVEVFRARLEAVEHRLATFEERERQATVTQAIIPPSVATPSTQQERCARCQALDSQAQSAVDDSVSTPSAARNLLNQASSLLPPFVTNLTSSGSNPPHRSRNSIRNLNVDGEADSRDHEPAAVSDIPSYVLLVGIGVCAVVLRVVLKKVGGRRP